MSPRLKLQAAAKPLLLAGALWGTAVATPVAVAGRPQTPPPCGPDGVCIPNPATYGWYQTRWRTFPGDSKADGPTAADRQAEDAKVEELQGPQPPEMSQEGVLNRTPPKRGDQSGAAAEPVMPDANEDIRNLPGLPPLPGPGAGPAAAPADGPAGAPAGDAVPGGLPGGGIPGGTLPGAEPESDPLNPLGSTPATPPWLSQSMTNPAAQELVPLPYVEQAVETAIVPVENIEPLMDGPNLQGDDAPPALPAALRRFSGVRQPLGRATSQAAASAPAALRTASAMSQPRSVQPAFGVQQASAVIPVGGQLVNPAGTMGAVAEDQGTQQAIYFEASDSK